MTVRDRIRSWNITTDDSDDRSVAIVLPITVATIVVTPLVDDWRGGALISIVLIGCGALFTLQRSGVRRAIRRPAAIVVVVSATIASTAGSIAENDSIPTAASTNSTLKLLALALFAVMLLLTPMLMLLRLLMRPRITLDTVAGALTAYLQVGIFFAVLYRLVDVLESGNFFKQGEQAVSTYQYFSFITLTTVGYGDYTPATKSGQLLASLEALGGQLFLVSVVALVVGNLGRDLPHRRAADVGGAVDSVEEDLDDDVDGAAA